jgi:DNA-binding response OmpR family regulator
VIGSAGYDVSAASDGLEGLNAIIKSPPDLVILDVMLPEIHGYAVCHRVKTNEALKHVKILIVSAKSFPADRRQAAEAGADGFMSKPVDPKEFLEAIKNLLNKK